MGLPWKQAGTCKILPTSTNIKQECAEEGCYKTHKVPEMHLPQRSMHTMYNQCQAKCPITNSLLSKAIQSMPHRCCTEQQALQHVCSCREYTESGPPRAETPVVWNS